jgi:hypothetical protein
VQDVLFAGAGRKMKHFKIKFGEFKVSTISRAHVGVRL